MKRLNFYAIPVIILLCLGLTIGVSKLTGYWKTERATLPRMVDGSFDPYDIRGSYSIGEVMDIFGIPKEDFYTELNIPSSLCASTQLKELESEIVRIDENGEEIHFGVSDVRDFVANYIGWTNPAPTTDHENTEAPIAIEQEETTITEEVHIPAPQNQGQYLQNPEEHTEEWTEPKGGTPLSVVYEWGVTQEMLEKQFKINFDEQGLTPNSTIRDVATAAQTNTAEVKDYVAAKMKKN